MRKITAAIVLFVTMFVVAGCSSIDCSLNSLVLSQYSFVTPDNKPDTLHDTLTITTNTVYGDTVLLNRAINITEFSLPVSYSLDRDTLFFNFTSKDGRKATDRIIMKKTNISHFESVDCPPTFFHNVEEIEHQGTIIDSVRVNDKEITNETTNKNIFIYLKSGI